MMPAQRLDLSPEVNDLIDAGRGTNEAFTVLCAADEGMPLAEALETLRRVAASLPREGCECDMRGLRRCGQCGGTNG